MKPFLFVLMFAGSLNAGMLYNFECITQNSSQDAAIGARQLFLSVGESGDRVQFTFSNSGPEAAVIGQIYFYGASLLTDPQVNDTCPGVDFGEINKKVSPSQLPGFHPTAQQANALFAVGAKNPSPRNGVGPEEWVAIHYALKPSVDFQDLIDQISRGDLVIGMHVQGFEDGGSEGFVARMVPPTPVIPEPATMVLLGLGGLVLRRRTRLHG